MRNVIEPPNEENVKIIKKYDLKIKKNIRIDDNEVVVTCRICGKKCKRIYGKHLKHSHNNISTKEYKELFGNPPIASLCDRKNTSKNSGKHMKEEKYKKMFSEKILGDKNPMHRSKTNDLFRKSISPFSIEFYNKRFPELSIEERQEMLNRSIIKAANNRVSPTTIEYYLNQGMDKKEAKKALSNRQATFSKDICIKKYGEKRGLEVWMDRQEKWLDNLNKNGNLNTGYSNISQQLFREIEFRLGENDFMYGENGGEFKIRGEYNKKWYVFDFTDVKRKKIIEYNGDRYHANPKLFEANDYPHPFRRGIKSKDIWEKDAIKNRNAINIGYDVLVIWESEYNNRIGENKKNKTIQKCIDFMLDINDFSKNN